MNRAKVLAVMSRMEIALDLLVKCGGPGGKPGPCPTDHADLVSSIMKQTGYSREQLKSALFNRADPAHKEKSEIRSKVTDVLLTKGGAKQNAVLDVLKNDSKGFRDSFVKQITAGDADKVAKEFAGTPIYDLKVLGGINMKTHPIPGEANCNLGSRVLTMGSDSRTGSYRHELGHAIRSALGGASYAGKTETTKAILDEYNKVLQKVKTDPSGIKIKLDHEAYEKKYGVAGRRSLDNWEENFAEHYRLYHREVYKDLHEGGNGKFLAQYRERHSGMAKIFDAHYTAALIGQGLNK